MIYLKSKEMLARSFAEIRILQRSYMGNPSQYDVQIVILQLTAILNGVCVMQGCACSEDG